MVEFLKFVAKQTSFDPELVEVLASALDDAWCRIEKSGNGWPEQAMPARCAR